MKRMAISEPQQPEPTAPTAAARSNWQLIACAGCGCLLLCLGSAVLVVGGFFLPIFDYSSQPTPSPEVIPPQPQPPAPPPPTRKPGKSIPIQSPAGAPNTGVISDKAEGNLPVKDQTNEQKAARTSPAKTAGEESDLLEVSPPPSPPRPGEDFSL